MLQCLMCSEALQFQPYLGRDVPVASECPSAAVRAGWKFGSEDEVAGWRVMEKAKGGRGVRKLALN